MIAQGSVLPGTTKIGKGFMIIIHQQLVSSIAEEAKHSVRLRKNFNFHRDYADPVNRMLNAFEPGICAGRESEL
jgi:hypothetical protein